MADTMLEICGDCGVALPPCSDAAHLYLGASPSCWALFGEVLAREYSDPAYMKVHRTTVDAYAAQHPGKPERRSIQSVWVHLTGLYLVLDRGLSGDFARRVIGVMTQSSDEFRWLDPPDDLGRLTIADVIPAADAQAHEDAVLRWARAVWTAWREHHGTVGRVADMAVRKL